MSTLNSVASVLCCCYFKHYHCFVWGKVRRQQNPNRCLTGKHWRAVGSSDEEAGGGAQLAVRLPSICETLGSSLSTT